eukprot:5740735-Pleurochrysis_carterae.AAC.1
MGAGARRDAPDACAQPVALARRPAGRRPAQVGQGRCHRRPARRGGVWLRHGAAHRPRLHHDAQVPPEHLPRRHRDAGPRAAQEVCGQARARDQLLLLDGRGDARLHGADGLPHHVRDDWARRHAAGGRGGADREE